VGELGFWWRSIGGPPPPRDPLPGPVEADVAIVGAGYTGLWTAYYLKRAQPSLEVVVLEAEFAGFGASGRNGGWVAGSFSGSPRVYGREGYEALQRAMFATVAEIESVLSAEGIDADFVAGGQLSVALDSAQLVRLREHVAAARASGADESDLRELSPAELAARVRVAGARGASLLTHVARAHPAKLVTGLAAAVERLGVKIYERTPVTEVRPREARTARGPVRARWVVRATEGYTARLPGLRRLLVPLNSSMIITEPLPADAWEEIGWQGAETMDDVANVYVYLQRTADGRIAIGGRGRPYRLNSATDGWGETPPSTIASLHAKLLAMFPAVARTPLDHAWSGVLGVPRDWCASVDADATSGLAWAGGYVGLGVAASNLAARMLCDLLLSRDSQLLRLPWVGRRPPRWEPEPLRWAEIHSVYALYRAADRLEARSGRPSLLARAVDFASRRT
jgi:glycine/D-amino acid oxidase-like deaminating enzyme